MSLTLKHEILMILAVAMLLLTPKLRQRGQLKTKGSALNKGRK